MANEEIYQKRLDRINKAINHEPVDKIPAVFMGAAFAPRYMGMTISEFVSNPEAPVDVTLSTLKRLGDVDGVNLTTGGYHTVGLSVAWLSRVALPGKDLPENDLWQIREAELMGVDDYDTIIDKGWDGFMQGFLPKIMDMEVFQKHVAWVRKNTPEVPKKFREAGYVLTCCSVTTIPFEPLCGGRSMTRFFVDLYRHPDKVKSAMDVMLPRMIDRAVAACTATGVPRTWVGGWRSASAMLAPKLWDSFVFPYFYETVHALSEKGIISVLHWDHDWTRDLERLKEFPAKKCVLNLDGMTDIRKVKEILGDHTAIMGDVPPTLFSTGTPDDIYKYIKDLVRDIGPTGLILAPGCDAPINTKPENMEAFVAASREFGNMTPSIA